MLVEGVSFKTWRRLEAATATRGKGTTEREDEAKRMRSQKLVPEGRATQGRRRAGGGREKAAAGRVAWGRRDVQTKPLRARSVKNYVVDEFVPQRPRIMA